MISSDFKISQFLASRSVGLIGHTKDLKTNIAALIKTLPWELVMTLTDTFPMTPGMNPKESANRLWPILYWLNFTEKWEYLSRTFLPNMKPK